MSGQFTKEYLKELQGYPLSVKVQLTKQRIREWVHKYGEDGVYVSFSGGKDSTVLLHIVREMYPDVPAVFVDTGLEYPEIRTFVRTFDNVVWLKPDKNYKQVIEEYGYPIISKEISERIYYAKQGVDGQSDVWVGKIQMAQNLNLSKEIRNMRFLLIRQFPYRTSVAL